MKLLNKICISLLIVATCFSAFAVSAKDVEYAPYIGYEYDSKQQSNIAPITYIPGKRLNYSDFGTATPLNKPSDLYWDGNNLYILDSGNSRILILDSSYKMVGERVGFKDKDGNTVSFEGARGFALSSDGTLYISDTENQQILTVDKTNTVTGVIKKPDTSAVGFNYTFDVSKILLNGQGLIYAVASNVNSGAFTFDKDGNFLYFFGRGTVAKTADVLLNYIKKQFMTREQIQKQQNYTAATISNFDIDKDGFIYTVSKRTKQQEASVAKLNYKGKNILKTKGINSKYGDLEWDRLAGSVSTNFIDVDVDDYGFVFYLDSGRGRVFQYTDNGQMISAFGGYGSQTGSFSNPVALETVNGNVVVLDDSDNTLNLFEPTEYTQLLRKAFLDLDTSEPEKALEAWNEVLKHNTNSQFPYYGLGMAYEKLGEYKKAMECFKLSSSKSEYSDAFREYRKQFMSEKLPIIGFIIVLIIACIVVTVVFAKRHKKVAIGDNAYSRLETKYGFPLYTLFHPADGFAQFKYRTDLPSYLVSVIIVSAAFVISFISFFCTGFAFNSNDPEDYTVLSTLLSSFIIYIMFVVANWAVSSLLNGNGKMKEICSVVAYALIPYLCSQIVNILLSNVLTLNESMAITIVNTVGIVWSVLILIIGLSEIHQYYIGKTLLTVFLTVFAMVVIALIAFLFFSLMSQMISFVKSIMSELQLRY